MAKFDKPFSSFAPEPKIGSEDLAEKVDIYMIFVFFINKS